MPRHTKRAIDIPYTPTLWTADQALAHWAMNLDEAFKRASELAGGWYRRSVTICCHITEDNDEEYCLLPSEIAVPAGFSACYKVERIFDMDGR